MLNGDCDGNKRPDRSRPDNLHPDPVSNPSPLGSAINETRPGFSAPSSSGCAGCGPTDEEGPAGSSSATKAANDAAQRAYDAGHNSANHGGESAANNGHGSGSGQSGGTRAGSGSGGSDQGRGVATGSTHAAGGESAASNGHGGRTAGSGNQGRADSGGRHRGNASYAGPQPIILDLDGDGVQISELSRSTRFVDGGEGLLHKTAWAAAGNGVLFFDPDGRNAITERRQYVFTEWNPTASGDIEALRSVWDSNGDGKLTAADAEFAKFRVLVTYADGDRLMAA